jgi:CHAT domain-containing protein
MLYVCVCRCRYAKTLTKARKCKIDINQAFRKSQARLKKEYPEPYFWGAFMLIQTEK